MTTERALRLRTCTQCFAVHLYAGNKTCPHCGFEYPRTVRRPALPPASAREPWIIKSRDARGITVGGRHFYADRGPRISPRWRLREHDQQLAVHGSAVPLRVFLDFYETQELSDAVDRIVLGRDPEIDPSVTWDEWRATQENR